MKKRKKLKWLVPILACVISLGFSSFAASAETPNYTQDFSSGSLEGFVSDRGNDADWKIEDGEVKTVSNGVEDVLVFGEETWTEYAVDFEFTPYGGMYDGGYQICVSEDFSYLVGLRSFGWANSATGNLVELYGENGKTLVASEGYVNGITAVFLDGETMFVTVVVKTRQIRVFVNGTLYIDYTLSLDEPEAVGKAGLRAFQSVVGYDNIVVREITEYDLVTPEVPSTNSGGYNSHLEITTRSGQGDNSVFTAAGVGLAVTLSVAALGVCVVYWIGFVLSIVKNKKKNSGGK